MLFLVAFTLGFVGYLPLGNINLTVVQMSVNEEKRRWQSFILFAAIMEFIYCFGCLYGLQMLLKQPQLITVLSWSGVAIFFALGIYSILHNPETAQISDAKKGIFVAIVNPLQVPFWLIAGVYVMQNDWVKSEALSIALFSFICSLGTIAILYMYAVAGRKLVEKLNLNKALLSKLIGSLLIILAVYQALKLLTHHS